MFEMVMVSGVSEEIRVMQRICFINLFGLVWECLYVDLKFGVCDDECWKCD